MCGIAGIISSRSLPQLNIYNFISSIRHRGPDNWGYFIAPLGEIQVSHSCGMTDILQTGLDWSSTVGDEERKIYQGYLTRPFLMLAHARLSILDLTAAGNQPLAYNRDNLIIILNGEIYNYLELRLELKAKGYEFRTATDGEVVLAAYQEWGEDCIHKFNGMWAFAIYDRLKNRLFLSRDRLGVKSLFYTYNHELNYFAFTSEIKALLTLPGIKVKANLEECQNYLLYNVAENTENTFFQGIYRLPPASNLIIDLTEISNKNNSLFQSISVSRYWDLKINNDRCNVGAKEIADKAHEFYDLFMDAVKIRLRADVQVGTALSGGLDSSSNVYVINQLLKQGQAKAVGDRQYSFSSVFSRAEEKYADESYFIDLITRQLDIKSVKIVPTPQRLLNEVESLVYHQDEPFGSTSIFAQWCVFSLPRPNGILVTLDGQGADEQLAGYLSYLGIYWSSLPLLSPSLYREIWQTKDIRGGLKAGLRQLVVGKTMASPLSSFVFRLLMKRRMLIGEKVFGNNAAGILDKCMERMPEFLGKHPATLNERLAFDTQNSLPVLLRYADRNSMAYGIESRAPYLDYRLAEYLAALPADYKIHNGWTKYIARCSFSGKLPDEITWRRDKMGFPTPEKTWLRGPLREWGIDIIKKGKFLQELGVRSDLVNNYDQMANDFTLWRLINIELWAKVFKVN